jgi:hypothetical protein
LILQPLTKHIDSDRHDPIRRRVLNMELLQFNYSPSEALNVSARIDAAFVPISRLKPRNNFTVSRLSAAVFEAAITNPRRSETSSDNSPC